LFPCRDTTTSDFHAFPTRRSSDLKLSDMLSKRRSRSVARPRQVAMALAKELTNHSLPEIGEAFGGRDHTTVLHACRKIKQLEGRSEEHTSELQSREKLVCRLLLEK